MEKPLSVESCGHFNGCVDSYCHALTTESIQVSNGLGQNEDLAEGMLKELDSYWEDIDVLLTISSMVSFSVIKGMVDAVEQEAACKIAQKDLELERLKETLHLYHVNSYENNLLESFMNGSESITKDGVLCSSSSDAVMGLEKNVVSLGKLKSDTLGQLKDLREEIDLLRGGKYVRRSSSGSELVGLGITLREGISKRYTNIDVIVDSLSSSVECVYKQVDDIACLSKTLFSSWELEHQYQEDIESMVMKNCIHGLQEQFERRLRGQIQFSHCEKTNIADKVKEISSFRQELDAISNSLSNPEAGHLMFPGSMEFGDKVRQNERIDHLLHHSGSGNHASLSTSYLEANGNVDPPKIMHLKKEELVQYFRGEMAKMKIDHDYEIARLTEELFTLRAKYLKERDQTRSLPPQKDKEFDVLRSKIPDIITRLDDILLECAKLPALDNKDDSCDCLNERMGSVLSENLQLKDSLEEKKKEVDSLSSQLSDAVQKMSQHSLADANLVLVKENLETAIIDAHIVASIGEDVWKCVLNDVIHDAKCTIEEFAAEKNVMKEICEIISGDFDSKATIDGSLEFRDMWFESVSKKELVEVILKGALDGACMQLNDLSQDVYDKDKALHLEIMEKENLKQEMLLLKASIEEKEKLLQEALLAFEKEKMHLELASKELGDLHLRKNQDQILLQECKQEINDLTHKLFDALERIKLQEAEKNEINDKFDQAMKNLSNNSEEKRRLLSILQEKDCSLSAAESRENASREQMESAVVVLQRLLHQVANFREQVEGNFKRTDQRLWCFKSELNDIRQKVNMLEKMRAECKRRLERKTSDLDKAETEVDLLGDEVDALLSLLEKVYIALDHYSPVLRHYPGIVEILKLVRRELGGETATTRHGRSLQKSNIF